MNRVPKIAALIGTTALLWGCGGKPGEVANFEARAATTVNPAQSCGPSEAAFSVRVCGNQFVDAKGNNLQLRGVSVSGLEAVPVLGWSPDNPWGAQTGTDTPDWSLIKRWGVNVVRLPLNEASWLKLRCSDDGGMGWNFAKGAKVRNQPGDTVQADPGNNYQAALLRSVESATKAGLYVILDLHLAAPGNACPNVQNPMADADHSITFWSQVAQVYQKYPNVIFELFNEPFLDMTPALADGKPWEDLRNGGALSAYLAQSPNGAVTRNHPWQSAGMQQMLDAVRATGASNVVLTSTLSYAGAIYNWLPYKPSDPKNQLAAVWHAYSADPYPAQVNCVGMPGCSAKIMAAALAIQAAGYPILITEFGDDIGGQSSPFASVLLPFADSHNIGYLAWTWDVWPDQKANVLIKDAAGTPSQGYGMYVKTHYLCRAAQQGNCP